MNHHNCWSSSNLNENLRNFIIYFHYRWFSLTPVNIELDVCGKTTCKVPRLLTCCFICLLLDSSKKNYFKLLTKLWRNKRIQPLIDIDKYLKFSCESQDELIDLEEKRQFLENRKSVSNEWLRISISFSFSFKSVTQYQ